MSDDQHRRKIRTREHVIADLGVNCVERHVLLAGFTAERIANDYGIDLHVVTFNPNGEVENGQIKVQVKSTDHLKLSADGQSAAIRVATADFKFWLLEWGPVVLVLYDAVAERAFWLDVQEYARHQELDEDVGGATITLHIPVARSIDAQTMRIWRDRLEETRNRPRRPGAPDSAPPE